MRTVHIERNIFIQHPLMEVKVTIQVQKITWLGDDFDQH